MRCYACGEDLDERSQCLDCWNSSDKKITEQQAKIAELEKTIQIAFMIVRSEINDPTQGTHETLGKIEMRINELAKSLEAKPFKIIGDE